MRSVCVRCLLLALPVLLSVATAGGADRPSPASRPARRGTPTIEKPIEPSHPLVLENALKVGEKIDVARFKGKVVILRGLCPE